MVALLVLGVLVLVGWQLWQACLIEYHVREASDAVARYHNLRAQYHLQRCLAVSPREPRALLLAARVARRVGAFDVAAGWLDQYQDVRGSDDDLVLERVLLRAARGDVDEVRAFCRARIDEDHPSAGLVREAVSAGLIHAYRLQEADRVLHDWLLHDPDNTQALLLDGTIRELRIQTIEAVQCYRRAVELDPEHDEARLRLVNVLVQTSNGQEALPHAEYLNRQLPDNVQVQLRLAQCQALLGESDQAAATLDDLLRRLPHHAAALAERGKLALHARDAARAEALLREAVRRDPSALDARYLLTQALRLAGKADEAAAELEQLTQQQKEAARIQKIATQQLQQRPNDPALLYEVGVISLRAGAVRDGLRWLHRALEIDPRHAAAHEALAGYYERTGNSTLADRHRRLASPR
jgi:predicted Zn-dependent protease